MPCDGGQRVELDLASTKECVHEATDKVSELLSGANVPEETIFDVKLALQEAVVNALEHGNKYDERKRICVSCAVNHEVITVVVRDEGEGFDPAQVPDPTRPENVLKEHGRGIFLIRNLSDKVRFNRKGNEVTIVKRAGRPARAQA